MSAISSIGGSGQDLYQFLQSVSASGASAPSGASATAVAQTTGTDATGAAAAQPHHHHHHGGGGGGDLFKKIEDAVTAALKSAQSQGANGASADPNQTIEDAIAQVFKQQQQGTSVTSAAGQSNAPSAAATGDADPIAAVSAQDGQSPEATARNAFFDALKSFGVSAQQFHADFLAALQQSHDGQPNVGAALKSFPPGSVVDTTG